MVFDLVNDDTLAILVTVWKEYHRLTESLLTGMPDSGLNINYEPNSNTAYASPPAANMKRLGIPPVFSTVAEI
ncbi:MAG: hypothetical protein R6X15_07800 [Pseudomonadota bacterium]